MNISCTEDTVKVACLQLGQAILTIASMLTVMLIIVLGNALVVLTVYRDRKLRLQRQNWLIVSLAIADLLVGLLVMPLTLIYEIIGEWRLGDVLCEIWLALDVLFVTASILHMCAISLDRYFSVTQPLTYPAKRTPKRMFYYIGVSWVVSTLICLPPILGWRPERQEGECSVSTDVGYVVYSSLGSFYIPVIILVLVYAKIYSITIKHSRQRLMETERRNQTLSKLTKQNYEMNGSIYGTVADSNKTEVDFPDENSDPIETEKDKKVENQVCWQVRNLTSELPTPERKKVSFSALVNQSVKLESSSKRDAPSPIEKERTNEKRKRKLKAKERQATLLLGIILSAFILSWLPFFFLYVIGAFGYEAPAVIFKFFFWLGYCNSGINPVIYTVFNREFKRGLCRQLKRYERYATPFTSFYRKFKNPSPVTSV